MLHFPWKAFGNSQSTPSSFHLCRDIKTFDGLTMNTGLTNKAISYLAKNKYSSYLLIQFRDPSSCHRNLNYFFNQLSCIVIFIFSIWLICSSICQSDMIATYKLENNHITSLTFILEMDGSNCDSKKWLIFPRKDGWDPEVMMTLCIINI